MDMKGLNHPFLSSALCLQTPHHAPWELAAPGGWGHPAATVTNGSAPQIPREASRDGGSAHGPAVVLMQMFSQEQIQGWPHHRAGGGQTGPSALKEDAVPIRL